MVPTLLAVVLLAADGGVDPDGLVIETADPIAELNPMDKAAALAVVHAHLAPIHACYVRVLRSFPKTEGTVTVKFVVNPTGNVAAVVIASSTVGNADLETCVAKEVKTWTFVRAKDARVSVLKYPFVFKPGAPTAVAAEPVVTGALDKEQIRKVIHTGSAEVRTCYEASVTRSIAENFSGKVVVTFTILPSGAVAPTPVGESAEDNDLAACIADKVSRWTFPRPKDGRSVAVRYPFIDSTR